MLPEGPVSELLHAWRSTRQRAGLARRACLCNGQSNGNGGDPQPEAGLEHLHVESQVVTAGTKPPSQREDPWSSPRAGAAWGGVQSRG